MILPEYLLHFKAIVCLFTQTECEFLEGRKYFSLASLRADAVAALENSVGFGKPIRLDFTAHVETGNEAQER